MNVRRIFLFPISILYGIGVWIRNFFYDIGVLKPKEVNVNTIGVGNLSTGGTGKTPHVEYIIKLIKDQLNVATLSRGYGRKSSGYVLADENSKSDQIGDEPRQYKQKFKNLTVAVCENRLDGIKNILNQYPDTNVVVLDDVFQHRSLKTELNIVLTDYNNLYYKDMILPSGNLREFAGGIKRADVIIVTKTPLDFSPYDRRNIELKIAAKGYQKVFFSYLKYGQPVPINEAAELNPVSIIELKQTKPGILLFSGIANPSPLEDYLKWITPHFTQIRFSDHHLYNSSDMQRIKKNMELLPVQNKIIITTEKDFNRLDQYNLAEEFQNIPFYYLPIEVEFNEKDKEEFNNIIIKYATRNKIYVGVYKG
jgi:tetraacyldisaccharide 4'-kinase